MESADQNKNGASGPPKLTMRTRRQVAEEKRKAEEEIKQVKEVKRRKEMYEPRENEDVKPQDIILDPKLLKIYIGHVETEKEVKVEVVSDDSEDEEGHQELDGATEVFQQPEEIEEEAFVPRNELQNVQTEENSAREHLTLENYSFGLKKRGTFDPRRQSADAKRKAEEETKPLEEDNPKTTMFASRKHGRFGPHDLSVDRNLSKTSGDQGDLEDVKNDDKFDHRDDDMDRRLEVFQQVEEMEEADVIAQQNLMDKVLPILLPFLKQKDIFRCRLVNKQWRGMIDDFLEDSVAPKHYDDEAYLKRLGTSPNQLCPLPKFRIVKYAYQFRRERDLENFNEAMKSHMDSGLSPFVGGTTVILKNLFIESLSSYYLSRSTEMFLESFGAHIQRLVIKQASMVPTGFLECVKKCLHYVPNLQRLKLSGEMCLCEWDQKKMAELQLELFRNEMVDRTPKLNKLDTLEFQCLFQVEYMEDHYRSKYLPYLEETLGDIMIKPYYRSQLKTLQLDWVNNSFNFKLCNVKELSLVNLQCDLKELKFTGPVEKLFLSKSKRFSKVSHVDIFKKFPFLRYLSIDKTILMTSSMESNLLENNVHTLEIMNMESQDFIPANLDFVLPKLRYLILRNYKNNYTMTGITSGLDRKYDQHFKNGRVKIAHLICGGTSYDSSIWRTVPQLEIFTLQFQDHDCYNPKRSNYFSNSRSCECQFMKGTKYECPFKNIVETREGYQKYQERVSRLTEQCFGLESGTSFDLEGSPSSPINCSRSCVFEKEEDERREKMLALEKDISVTRQVWTFVFPLLNQKDIFRCRQLNKQWRRMVDDFIKKSIVPQYYDDKAYLKRVNNSLNQLCPLPKFRIVKYSYQFNSERILEQFNKVMAGHMNSELSPFVGGATVTLDNLFVTSPLLKPALKEFLGKFGVHIKNLVIRETEHEDDMDVIRFVEYVKLVVYNAPALERLNIIGTCPIQVEQSEMDRIKMEVYRNEMINRVPKLGKLTTLQMDFSKTVSKLDNIRFHERRPRVPFIDEIFHDIMIKPFYQTQLKHFQLGGELTMSRNINLKMSNLKELSLIVRKDDPRILNGKWLEAPVEKLILNIESTEKELFNVLRIFPLVRYLKFEYSDVSSSSLYCEEDIKYLDNVHTVELVNSYLPDVIFRGFPKSRFLIIGQLNYHLTKRVDDDELEELENKDERRERGFCGAIGGLLGPCRQTTFDTDIWELLPKLEVIKLQFRNHDCCNYHYSRRCNSDCVKGTKYECPFKNFIETREGYQMYCERMSRLMKQFK